jgi:GH35 family endo-1,4-beta-xylanase
MRDHITTLVSRYQGKVHGWVVANEVIDVASPTGYRQDITHWSRPSPPERAR